MRFDELEKIAEENDYELTKSHGYYKFTRKNRRNYIICKFANIKQMWVSFPMICDDKDSNMNKATIEFAKTIAGDREEE